ncbi:terminase large subunit domain-containing protein [Streptomyces sp. ME19-01-6]|uniref:terminase large subunit domain-containing protein n=1 Tax=Streptomyces sp. ME19-01-6 TaxID=3028686 RepID=UPI0029A32BD5|nr:terminase family protein [Streptomyces sp. ME19-01-6]MDX3232876.1 terminase family protein [Streptomyces sp. ME19-01-6]
MTTATADIEEATLDHYRTLPVVERRRIARRASPELRLRLAHVERTMALDRSPGALANVLTSGREMQARHLDLVDQAFQRIAAGERLKVLLTVPPRHGKSRRASRWGPVWYLRKHPDHRVMLASYAATLADDHGRWIRDTITGYSDALGIALNPASRAANRFDIEGHEGGMVTAGVGGGLTGKGANLAIVDDPVKGAEDAESPTQRERVWEWWQSVLLTRLEPTGSLLVIQTRWHPEDLAGRLLETEGDEWIAIDLPAIALSDTDALGRQPGEALWPERYGAPDLERIRKGVGERVWWSLYQQQPRPLEGGVWQWDWISKNRISPVAFRAVDLARVVVALDPAGGDTPGHDESGIVAAGRSTDGHYYVLADRTGKHSAENRGRETCLLALELDADAIVVETNYGGDMARQNVVQAWAELERQGLTKGRPMPRVLDVTAKKGKRLRAEPIAQLYETGFVHHCAEFNQLETQMVTWVPGLDSPDRMDAAVHALTELANPAAAATGSTSYADHRLSGRR